MSTKSSSQTIFKNASSTYYYASLLFPKEIREDVFTLYAFVRTADDLVDSIPQKKSEFLQFRKTVNDGFAGETIRNNVVKNFIRLHKKRKFDVSWTTSFLDAMESDLKKPIYNTFKELEKYIYGSAEVMGLYMASIMELPKESYETARLQGKAMQLINFIRDVSEDMDMKRQYLPLEDLKKFGLRSFNLTTSDDRKKFRSLIHFEIERYKSIQYKAEKGYTFIKKQNRIPIQTAASMYEWTAEQIYHDPLIVFEKKVKPSKWRLFGMYIKHVITS